MCTIPKQLLDDIDTDYTGKTKEFMLQQLAKAWKKGEYPGWEDDLKEDLSQRGIEVQPGQKLKARPLMKPDNTLVVGRGQHAASRMGRHFVVNFFDDMHLVDLHAVVSTLDLLDLVSFKLSQTVTGCVLFRGG